jgi:hypothetical protein
MKDYVKGFEKSNQHYIDFKGLVDKSEIDLLMTMCNEILQRESLYVCMEENALGIKITKPYKSSYDNQSINDYKDDDPEERDAIVISNTFFIPQNEIVKHFIDGHETRYLQLFAIQKEDILKTIMIPVEELLNEKWIYKNWGLGIRISVGSSYRHVLQALQILIKFVPTIHHYNYSGWLEDRDWIFLHGGGTIGNDTMDQIIPDVSISDFALNTTNITEEEAISFVFETMLTMADKKVSWILLSYTLLSLITSRLQKQKNRPQYILYIVGESGLRKTSLSIKYFNFYERFLDTVPVHFDMTTQPAMEIMGMTLRDSVCLYDDIPPAKDNETRRTQEKKLEALIQTYGESIGRQKMDGSSKKVEMKPTGLAAVTAESVILKNPSSISRTLIVKLAKDSVNLKKLSLAQKNKYHFPTAVKYYLEYITEQGDRFVRRFNKKFLKNREMFREILGNVNIHGRLINAAAWQQTAFSFYLDYVESKMSSKALEKINFNTKRIRNEKTELLVQMLKDQQQMIIGNNEVNLFIQAVKELLATNKIRLLNISPDGKRKTVSEDFREKDVVGFVDSEYIFFFKDTIYNLVCSHYKKQNIVFAVDLRSLLDALDKKNILKPDRNKDNTKTVRITIKNSRIKVIRLDKDMFETWDDNGSVDAFFDNDYSENQWEVV